MVPQGPDVIEYNINSKIYKIDTGTLTDWNKRLEKDGLVKDINSWARKLTPNVIFALYKNIIKSGKAHEVKAWFEIVENNQYD